MQRLVLLAALTAALLPVAASAQGSAPAARDPNRVAYGHTLRCFATAVGVSSDPRSTPAEKTAAEARSRLAFDAGVRLGRVLGFSGQRVGDDFDATSRAEAALQVRDVAYTRQAQAQCARLGM